GCALLRDLVHPTANAEIAIGIVRIDESDGHAWVTPDVFIFRAADSRVHPDFAVLKVHPHRRGVGAAVGKERGKASECWFLKQIEKILRNRSRHAYLLTYSSDA